MNSKIPQHKRAKKAKRPNFVKSNQTGAPLENGNHSQRRSLLAKDSEWIDIIGRNNISSNDCNTPSGEKFAQLDNDFQIQPFTRMFPNLLQESPGTLEAIASRTISTTEVTKYLIGHKANFEFLKRVNRLIPPEKEWMDRLTECSNSTDSSDFSTHDKCLPSCCAGKLVDIEMDPKTKFKNIRKKITK